MGRTFRALVDEQVEGGVIARLERQAPDVDGITMLPGCRAETGDFVDVDITSASDYDLEGEC